MRKTISILTLVAIVILGLNAYTSNGIKKNGIKKNGINGSNITNTITTALNDQTQNVINTISDAANETKDTAEKLTATVINSATSNTTETAIKGKNVEGKNIESKDEIRLEGNKIIPIISVKVLDNPNDPNLIVADSATNNLDKTARASLDTENLDTSKSQKSALINFDFASSQLTDKALNSIFMLKNQLTKAKVIELQGYTDSIGNDNANLRISSARIVAVKNELTRLGAEKSKFKEKPMGAAMPIASNKNADGRKANRRVEINLIY